jgi:hypothetical protein
LGDQERPLYYKDYPCTPLPKHLDDFYIIKIAYHFHELCYTLAFKYHKKDTPEMTLHHIVTLMLIVFSYTSNSLPIGAVIMFIHDISDVFLNVFKIVVETQKINVIYITYFTFMINWLYFRIYFFPMWAIRLYYEDCGSSSDPM